MKNNFFIFRIFFIFVILPTQLIVVNANTVSTEDQDFIKIEMWEETDTIENLDLYVDVLLTFRIINEIREAVVFKFDTGDSLGSRVPYAKDFKV